MKQTDQEALDSKLLAVLIILLLAAVAPHILHLENWITGFFLFVVTLRIASMFRPGLLPGKLLLSVLAILGLANVIVSYPVLVSGETAIALMTSMVGLKLLEIHTRRDLFIVVFIGYFLLTTQFLFNQSALMMVYVIFLTIAFTAVLVENSRSRASHAPVRTFAFSLKLLLQAIPIMLVLFVFFPRLAGPLWSLYNPDRSGRTGLSDSIIMGSISELIESRKVAFRVEFLDQVPSPTVRYWRGPILWDTDGRKWERGKSLFTKKPRVQPNEPAIDYIVTLEPTGRRWVMVLDLPKTAPDQARLMSDFQVLRANPIHDRIRYQASSWLNYTTGEISRQELLRGLQLPDNITGRMRELVQKWKSTTPDKASLVVEALKHFRNEEFYYTLRPPLLGDNPVDEFMFESRRGFCEHFASSFTLLMRLAGIPSRIVTGYQGGEYNPLGGHLVIRQSDAHAWSEVWLENAGWVRIDPTAAVAPERIERSFNFDFGSILLGEPVSFDDIQQGILGQMLKQMRWSLDAMNASWHRWVLGYTRDRQSRLMQIMGMEFLKGYRLAFAMVGFGFIVVLIMGFIIRRGGQKSVDAVLAEYLKFCTRLKRHGLVRAETEGPEQFLQRISETRPDITPQASSITQLYVKLRYGKGGIKPEIRTFRNLVRRFRP